MNNISYLCFLFCLVMISSVQEVIKILYEILLYNFFLSNFFQYPVINVQELLIYQFIYLKFLLLHNRFIELEISYIQIS